MLQRGDTFAHRHDSSAVMMCGGVDCDAVKSPT